MGGGIESTSHKYGLFQYICKSYEMVLADASRVVCSAKERPELFSAIPFSYGTLGFLTAVEIDIIPYKPYIRLAYHPVYSLEEAVAVFKRETEDPDNDSVEGLLFSRDEGVVMSGSFVDSYDDGGRSEKLNRIGYWFKPWFYKHAESFLRNRSRRTEVRGFSIFCRGANCT
jgi:Delta24-sterol reductase